MKIRTRGDKFLFLLVSLLFACKGINTPSNDILLLTNKTASWSSYDRTWFSGPDKQEILILILKLPRAEINFYISYTTENSKKKKKKKKAKQKKNNN
jgi:hypothetical protein